MSRRRLWGALPAILHVGWKDALAYRGELIVWMLTMTLPIVMLSLFRSVAQDSPGGQFGGFDAAAFTAYFLAGLVVRQMCSTWSVYIINAEIRSGQLGMRLMRPVHPLWSFLGSAMGAIPLRAILSVPLALALLFLLEGSVRAAFLRDPALLVPVVLSFACAFGLSFCISSTVGALGLYFESALGLWSIYLGFHGLLSGYLVPISLLPHWLQTVASYTPYPSMQAVPLGILLGRHSMADSLRLVATQAAWLVGVVLVMLAVWRNGEKRFAAYGG